MNECCIAKEPERSLRDLSEEALGLVNEISSRVIDIGGFLGRDQYLNGANMTSGVSTAYSQIEAINSLNRKLVEINGHLVDISGRLGV